MPHYVDGTEIILRPRDRIFLDADFYAEDAENKKFETKIGLLPRCLFPVSGQNRYIALMDDAGETVCILRDLDTLFPDSKAAVRAALYEYYMIPKIQKVHQWVSHQGCHTWTVDTDHGPTVIEIMDSTVNVKRLFDDRVLIKDTSDNRYEIPNLNDLDARSLRLIMPDI